MEPKTQLEEAVELLEKVLVQSLNPTQFDDEIYDYLKKNNFLPEQFIPYWEEPDFTEG